MKESVQSESTYNRKQRNLACSDSDFLGLIGEDESRGVEGLRTTHRRNKYGGWRGIVIERNGNRTGGRDKEEHVSNVRC